MGKPAARITDMTAHGGTIAGPGVANVLIGKMPAAVMGDNHICPMVTPAVPPVPHVGGPITLGSTGVLIGKRPAARMGDMCVCVGPPSTVLTGCFTVLIGETASGSGKGAGGAAAASSAKVKKPGQVKPLPAYKPAADKSANNIATFQFRDSAGKPISGVAFTWKDPDGKEHACVSDAEGRFLQSGFQKKGSFNVTVRRMARPKWSQKKAKLGDTINLKCSAKEYTGQEPVTAALMQSINGVPYYVKPLEAKNNGSNIQAVFPANLTEAEINAAPAPESGPVDRKWHVLLQDENNVMLSEPLDLRQDIEQTLNTGGAPADNTRVEMRLGDGSFTESETDAEGNVAIKDAPLGKHKVTAVEPAQNTEEPKGSTYLQTEDNLNRGDRDEKGKREGRPANITGNQVYDLQADLKSFGYEEVGEPDGIYGKGTQKAVKAFQKDAKTKYRKKGDETQELEKSTYDGDVNGVISDAEKEEIKIWKEQGYVKPDRETEYFHPLGKRNEYPVTSEYGPRSLGYHYGIDYGVPVGKPVYAVNNGTIIRTKDQGAVGYGKSIYLADGANIFVYGHLNSFAVNKKTQVTKGQLLGYSGNTGRSTGPHLHFEVRENQGSYPKNTINPRTFGFYN